MPRATKPKGPFILRGFDGRGPSDISAETLQEALQKAEADPFGKYGVTIFRETEKGALVRMCMVYNGGVLDWSAEALAILGL